MLPELTIRAAQALIAASGCTDRPHDALRSAGYRLSDLRSDGYGGAEVALIAEVLWEVLYYCARSGIDASAALAARLAAARQESEAQGPLLFDGRPSDDPERRDAEEPTDGVQLLHRLFVNGNPEMERLVAEEREEVRRTAPIPHGTPPGRLPAAPLAGCDTYDVLGGIPPPAVWVAPAAGADLTPTAGMELEREIADAVEMERREGLR